MKNLKSISLGFLLAGMACQQNPKSETTSSDNSTPLLTKVWESDTLLTTSESVIYHPELDVLFVSCIGNTPPDNIDGDGFIAQVSPENGEILNLKWIKGLSAPKGMGIVGNSLFVADISQVVEIDIAQSKIIGSYLVDGAKFLNDITVTADSTVLISDSGTNQISQIKNGRLSLYKEGEPLAGPNGLLVDGDDLYIASFGGSGAFIQMDRVTQQSTVLVDSISGGDGVVAYGDDFVVSTWAGEIYHVTRDGTKTLLQDTREAKINAADIWYSPEKELLLVPTFFANSVTAYKIEK
ncbi:hypothetical protein [Reichenbachiella sp. MSK19-1]|uniref:hypothetical protein n=1 Tax=Reichenbachiella sp. MSK19-1 TaxID=1897631 RepID=UPI0011C39CDB|nr:hypothetical protein [Reichenbachiella sp. MSK19-1]